MHATIDDKERTAPGLFPVNDPRDVDAAFAHEEAPEFEDDPCFRMVRMDRTFGKIGDRRSNRHQIERLICREIRDAEPTADVQEANRVRNMLGQPQ